MSKDVLTVTKEEKVIDVVKLMDEHNIGAIPVVDEHKKPIGIITERDILRRVVAKEIDIHKKTAEDIMTKNPKTISADSSMLEATRLMSENNFRRLIIVEHDKLAGIITAKDVIEIMSA